VKALVLAAGYATRLYPLTLDRPKALLEVGGRPMLDRVLEALEPMRTDGTIVVTNSKFTPHFESGRAGGTTSRSSTTARARTTTASAPSATCGSRSPRPGSTTTCS
jgi:glucose-1-phosphate thymidylyltransferase